MEQLELLRHVVSILEDQNVVYAVVGSIASATYGEPRMTRDIDIVVRLSLQQVEPLCRAFSDDDFYVPLAAAREAITTGGQFNIIHMKSGNKIDFMIARNDAWGRSQLARRLRRAILPDAEAYVAAPEDVILGKLWYFQEGGSDKHLRDIAAMLAVSSDDIDRQYIEEWSAKLGLTSPWQVAQQHGPAA